MINRRKIYEKFGGHCAYCGAEIPFKKMQVDHYLSKFLARIRRNTDNDKYENLMPSCAKCNNHKSGMSIEKWRREIALQVRRLKKNAQFGRALRFGQIEITESPIVFFFEKWELNKGRDENIKRQ